MDSDACMMDFGLWFLIRAISPNSCSHASISAASHASTSCSASTKSFPHTGQNHCSASDGELMASLQTPVVIRTSARAVVLQCMAHVQSWLVGWLVDWLCAWLVGWLVGWVLGCWLVGVVVRCLVGWLGDWLAG